MNELLFLGVIILSSARFIGLCISLDYYFETKKTKFISISFGFFIQFISGFLIIALNYNYNDFLFEFCFVFNVILTDIGIVVIIFGIISYFIKIPTKIVFLYIAILLTGTIFIWFIFDYNNAINFAIVTTILSYFYAFFLSIFKRSQFKKYMGRSIKWYYITCIVFFSYIPVSIIATLQGYSFGLYYADNYLLVVFYYIITISTTVLMILLLIHIEYNISSQQKNRLTDKYSHNLGNALQAIYSCIELLDFKNSIDKDRNAILEDILRPKLKEASNLIKEIRKL